MVECPKCHRTWPWVSEQGAAIELIHHCIVCMCEALDSGDNAEPIKLAPRLELDGITALSMSRKRDSKTEIEPCPRCLHRRSDDCFMCDGLGTLFYEQEGTEDHTAGSGNENE
jgi:hypothetical protein